MPNKFFGQHFLKSAAITKKIVDALAPERGEVVFEIGPGHGELTRPLAEACKRQGSKLLAIEKDKRLAKEFAVEGAEVITSDALAFLKSAAFVRETGRGAYKVVGNIPYYLTGRLLRVISELATKPKRSVLMFQREVAERLIAEPPKMSRLAASVQYWAEPEIVARVPKEYFDPPPEVDSAIVLLNLKNKSEDVKPDRYYAALRLLFAQPRKTVLNNLRVRKKNAEEALRKININPLLRPQNLTVEQIAAIARILF